ncbi:UNVERIFIED_CONTAM: hypothetical protein Sindi_0059400 [Sesamum indicum]
MPNNQMEEGSVFHSPNVDACRHFDQTYFNFVAEPRIVRLDLCTDAFATHGQYGHTYSCWPVILTPYNPTSRICMSFEYMFLMMVIPGPSYPKCLLDVYLEPLIEELQKLEHVGVLMRDNVKNKTFTMRATFIWTVNDLPTSRVVSGWSTAGVMGCSVCMENTRVFYLQNGRKDCYFDCYRRFLLADHLYCRNKKAFSKNLVERKVPRPRLTGEQICDWTIEHIEKNVFDDIFNIVIDIKGKAKDSLNAQKDLKII